MIKIATIQDLDLVIELSNKFIKQAGYEDICDPIVCRQVAEDFLLSDIKNKIIFLSEDKGLIAGMVTPMLFHPNLIAYEIMWWVNPDERSKEIGTELLNAFENWAKTVGAKSIALTCLDDRVARFYEKNAYKLLQRMYMKDI